MELTSVKELYRNSEAYIDQTVTIGGWVRNLRDSKTFGFLVINDGTYFQTLQTRQTPALRNWMRNGRNSSGWSQTSPLILFPLHRLIALRAILMIGSP